jgi:hypothetical protein
MCYGVKLTWQEARGFAHGQVRPASVPLGSSLSYLPLLYYLNFIKMNTLPIRRP